MEKMLIVDEEKTARHLLNKILKNARYMCGMARNVEEARNILKSERFALLLTNYHIPGESRAVLARYVKEHFPATAIVRVTVVDNTDQAREIRLKRWLDIMLKS